jgi:hypothetical protein
VIFWVSQPVGPDESMLVTGGNLEGETGVELAQLADEDPGSPLGATPSLSGWTALQPASRSTRSLAVTVPSTWTAGVFALRLSNGTTSSAPRLINAPDPWFVQGDLGDAAQPGGYFYVAGTCLERTGGNDPQAALVKDGAVAATLPLLDRVTTSTGYALRFTVPATVSEGTYALWLHNGRGGPNAWVKFSTFIEATVETVTVRKAAVWPSTVVDVSQQAGTTDDERFANAIAAVPASGGRIYVPAGTYTLSTRLLLPDHTVLYGAGRDRTLIRWSVVPPADSYYSAYNALVMGKNLAYGTPNAATFALEDLGLTASADFRGNVVARIFNSELGWFRRVSIQAPTSLGAGSGTSSALYLRRVANTLVDDVVLEGDTCLFARDGISHLRVLRSTLNWSNANAFVSSGSHSLLFVGNTLNQRGNSVTNGWAAQPNPNPGMWYTAFYGKPFTRDTLWANNVSTRDDAETPPGYVGYTSDGGQGIYLGKIASAGGTTVNLAGKTTAVDDSGKATTYAWTGAIAEILDGPGAGQWRYLTQAIQGSSTVQVDRPWDVVPDSTSTVTLVNLQGRLLMIDNDFAQEPLNQDYFLTLDCVKAGNRFGVTGTTSTVVSWMGKHYQGTHPAWHLQVLGNDVSRGTNATFSSMVASATSGYTGVVGSAHVYRRNTNTSSGTTNLYLRSQQGPFSDAVIEQNQVNAVRLQNQATEPINLSGVLIRGNTLPAGGASPVQPEGAHAGVTVVP